MNLEKLLHIDRKVIFVLMGVAIVIPLAFPFRLPVGEQPPTRGLFDAIEQIDPAKQALMVSTDWTPQTEAENQPMTVALIRHGLARKMRVVVISFYNESIPLANQCGHAGHRGVQQSGEDRGGEGGLRAGTWCSSAGCRPPSSRSWAWGRASPACTRSTTTAPAPTRCRS